MIIKIDEKELGVIKELLLCEIEKTISEYDKKLGCSEGNLKDLSFFIIIYRKLYPVRTFTIDNDE